jgi:hypothetical protein
MKSKIIFEQVVDWDAVEQEALSKPIANDSKLKPAPKPKPLKPDPPKVKKDAWGRPEGAEWYGYDPKKKKYVTGPKVEKDDTEGNDTSSNTDAASAQQQFKLIQNAVQFYENISKLGRYINWDEERMQNVFVKFSMISRQPGLLPAEMAKYCDVIYQILFKMSGTRKSNSAAYEYWLSRNYASSTSWEYLQSISVPGIKSYEDWFKGDRFDYMDWDEFANSRYLDRIFSNVDKEKIKNKPSTVALTLKDKFTNDEIDKMVLSAYKNKIWGEPRGKRKNAAWIK